MLRALQYPQFFIEKKEKSRLNLEQTYIKQGDCLELLKTLPDKCIDLVVTDPPYEFASHGGGGAFGSAKRDYHNELEYAEITKGFNTDILDELMRVMKKVNIYIWCNKEQLLSYMEYFKDYNMDLLTWHKTNPVPTCNNKYLSDTEYLLFFREKGVKVYGSYKSKRKYYVTSTNKDDKKKYSHPTIKPLDITENLITNSSQECDIVLDPFMGSGTTGVAAKKFNRKFVGFEIDETYFNIAKNRIEESAVLGGDFCE
jgi:DNA modification methylase